MDDERIDFSSLDPSRDGRRWDALAARVADRAHASFARSRTVSGQLLAWWRPALAVAAAAAVAVWIVAAAAGPGRTADAGKAGDVDAAFARWALGERGASAWDDVASAGGDHGLE
jgi:hypothetical protein